MSLQLDDQQVLDVIQHLYKEMESEQREKLLDPDHLDSFKRKFIKPLYPHKYITQQGVRKTSKYSCSQICCELSSGSTIGGCCCKVKPPDHVFREFGLGASIYFNFMKHFSCIFFFVALISVLSVGICYFVTISNGINSTENYQTTFFSTTMGSFSALNFECKYATRDQTILTNYNFALSCPVGDIYQRGPVLTSYSQESLTNCKVQRQKFDTNSSAYYIPNSSYTLIRSQCNTSKCMITLTFATIPSSNQIISYPYACIHPMYKIADSQIQERILIYVVVGLDLLITLIFIFFLCCEHEGQEHQIDHFKQYQLTLNDFSVKVKGFNQKTFDQDFEQFIKTIKMTDSNFDQKVVQIKIPDDQKYIQIQQNRKQQYAALFKFMQLNFFDNQINPFQYRQSKDLISNIFNSIAEYLSFKQQLCELLYKYQNSKSSITYVSKSMSIYMVLSSGSDLLTLKRSLTKSCCSQSIKTRSGGRYTLDTACVPDMLQWHNKSKWTCFRLIFSWLITLIIVVGSYLLFGFIQWRQNLLLEQYNFASIDCKLFYVPNTLSLFDNTLYAANNVQYTHCYCSENYFSLHVTSEVETHCESWLKSYITYLAIPILISMGLVLYNLIVSIVFKKLTEFEGHFMITDQLFSYTIKRSFILIMNMGLIIVLLNINYKGGITYNQVGFLFQGQFKDLTSDWYIKIGSIVIMTMIFNILFPVMELVLNTVFKCFRKCFDKRCWCVKTSKKYKQDYIKLYSGDIYPIEERYAFIISIFWITLGFNTVIPVLNIIAAISFVLLEIFDRIVVFKFFKTPANYDETFHKKFMKTLYVGLILHTVASAFMLSQPNLVAQNSTIGNITSFNSNNQRLDTLFQTYYIIPYVILFVLLVLYAILKQTILGLLSGCCKKVEKTSIYKIRNGQSFYESLSEYQLNKLKVMTEKQISRLENQRRLNSPRAIRLNDININFKTDHSEMQIFPNISTVRKLQQQNIQMTIARRTYQNILRHLSYYKHNQDSQKKALLIGMPGYSMSTNQSQGQQQKKMLQLDSALQQIIVYRKQ